jgi:hypothetical protein
LLFQKVVTVPADTKETAKIRETLKVLPGMLDRVTVNFRDGCHGMVYIQVLHASSPLVPSERDQAITGDGQEITTLCNTEVKQGYETLDIYAWSPGTTYEHKIMVTVNVFTQSEYSRLETEMEEMINRIEKLNAYLGVPAK